MLIVNCKVLFSIMYYCATGDDPVEKINEGMKYFLLKLMLCHIFDNEMMYVYVFWLYYHIVHRSTATSTNQQKSCPK